MKKAAFLLLSAIVFVSCIKDKQTTWETDMRAPIVKSELTISDILKSDDIIENPDSSLKLVYSTELFSMNSDSFITLPDSTFEVGASLQSLELPDDTVEYRITMADIARSMGGFYEAVILSNHGNNFPLSFPSPTDFPVSGTSVDISMNDLFDELILDSGVVEVIIENETPFDVKDIDFSLKNKPQPGGSELINHNFPLVASKGSASEEFKLNDDTIKSELLGELKDMTVTVPAGTFAIDTNEAIIAKVIVKDLHPREATAIWPDQNVIDETQAVPFNSNIDVDFKDATIREGEIYFEMFSSLQDSIFITYEIANVFHPVTGLPFKIDTVIPPAPVNGYSTMSKAYPANGYHFDFNGNGIATPGDDALALSDDTINTYVTHLTARIKYTGEKKKLSLEDTVYAIAQVRDLKPVFARGFMNYQKITAGPSTVNFDLFKKVKSGNIELEDVDFEIEVDNGFGASALAKFINIRGTNAQNNTLDLNFFGNNDTMEIASAGYNGENQRTSHVTSSRTLTPDTSNIDQFIENLPTAIEYEVEVELNANVSKPSDWNIYKPLILDPDNPLNFIHHEDEISAKLNMEVPLSVIADSLVLVDTLDFSLNSQSGNEVESGTFKLLVDNGFPFDATTSLYFLDDSELIIDSLWSSQTIYRASVGANGKVDNETRSVIEFEVDADKMNVIKSASKMYVVARFHTFDLSDADKKFYKIYSHYSFGIKLVGDFKYKFSN